MDAAAELRSLIITGRRAHNLNLKSAVLAHGNLETLVADGVDLTSADLCEAKLRDSCWIGCHFEAAHCNNSDWTAATLRLCSLDGVHALRACFDDARLEDSTTVAADFSLSTFRSAYLTETSFSRAVLREAILDDAEGDGIDFRGADLRSASLKGVRFDEADFRGADLRGADLSGGRFHSADFRGALLECTRFDNADYSGATFDQGERPLRSVTATEEPSKVPDSAAINTLNEFLALLPAAISGTQPDQVMNRVQELIDKTAASAGYSREQQQAVHDCLSDLTKPGEFDTGRLQQMIAALNSDSNEPPEELKAWLEPFMKAMQKGRKP